MDKKLELQKQLEDVIKYSQEYPFSLNAAALIDQWMHAKAFYINQFNGGLINRTNEKMEIVLSETAKERKFNLMLGQFDDEDMLYYRESATGMTFEDFLRENYGGFFDNRVVVAHPQAKIAAGMKLSKCFKFFLPDFNITRFAQDVASRYIQDAKISGYLYLSIHPLDYLTLSENNNNWRSCHALDGDYRAGNLSYMVDETTVVAYLADEEKERLRCLPPGMTWYNKKWRMLIHSDRLENSIWYNRQYPFDSTELVAAAHDALLDWGGKSDTTWLLPQDSVTSFKTIKLPSGREYKLDENHLLLRGDIVRPVKDFVQIEQGLEYNDLIYSPHYTPLVSISRTSPYVSSCYPWWGEDFNKRDREEILHKTLDVRVGAYCKCPRCGNHLLTRSDSFLCNWCIAEEDGDDDFFCACDSCGSRIYELEDAHDMGDGTYLCEDCYNATLTEKERALHQPDPEPVGGRRDGLIYQVNEDGTTTPLGSLDEIEFDL